nr:hypothetical protein OH837_49275 [Streptomyces canus]
MSTETDPTEETPEDTGTSSTTDGEAPVDPPVEEDETKPEEGTEPPPAPDIPAPQPYQPATWYSVESVCTTEACPNLNTTTVEPMVYSNAGTIIMVCGLCGHRRPILSATKLDPQPEMS